MFFLESSVFGVPVIPTNTMKKTRSKKNMKQHKLCRKTWRCGLYFVSDFPGTLISYDEQLYFERSVAGTPRRDLMEMFSEQEPKKNERKKMKRDLWCWNYL